MERLIQFVRSSFLAGRSFSGIDDFNAQADTWCATRAAERLCPDDTSPSVRQVFEQQRPYLLALPDNPLSLPGAGRGQSRQEAKVGKRPYVRFDRNDYAMPFEPGRRTLTVLATLDTVRVGDGEQVLAMHPRCFERARRIELPEHIEALAQFKPQGREHRAKDHLHHAAPSAQALFIVAAERRQHSGSLTRGLLELLRADGPNALKRAIAAARERDPPHLAGVRPLIDAQRHHNQHPPPLPLTLPDDPRHPMTPGGLTRMSSPTAWPTTTPSPH